MKKLTVRKIGNSEGVILPKEILALLHVSEGDELCAIQTANGIELSMFDPEFAQDMDLVDDIMRKNKNALKKLAE